MLRRLAFHGVRIDQLDRNAALEGTDWPRGTWVIPMEQEFAELVRQLFDVQRYPDLREYPDGPPEQPYDAAGWTLPFQMDVRVVAAEAPLPESFRAALRPLGRESVASADGAQLAAAPDAPLASHPVAAAIVPPAGRITGTGPRLAVSPAQNEAFRLINRALGAGGSVRFEPLASRGTSRAGGSRYLVEGVDAATLARWVDELALRAERTNATGPTVRARIGLYKPWTASMDEGWTRWLLDQWGFTYNSLSNADIQNTPLRDRFDVIVLASDAPRTIVEGFAKGSVPPRYEGGIGEAGARALDTFVRAGGTLVCLNQSSEFAIQYLHLPVKNAVAGLPRAEFFSSGSIFEVSTEPAHPVMAGMPDRAKVFFDRSPVFATLHGFEGDTLARYATAGSPLLSGYLLGEKHLQGQAAALDVKHGNGHVILIGFRPQWRGQPFGTFRVLFNALFFGGELAARAPAS
jgi:hypothetical protein